MISIYIYIYINYIFLKCVFNCLLMVEHVEQVCFRSCFEGPGCPRPMLLTISILGRLPLKREISTHWQVGCLMLFTSMYMYVLV